MECLQREQRDRILILTLDRPPVNAANTELIRALHHALREAARDESISVVVITGSGDKAFCAGIDIKETAQLSPEGQRDRQILWRETAELLAHMPQVTLAAINGPALGLGCGLITMCDLRIAAEKATIGLPEINVGRAGGGAHLSRFLPPGWIRRMLFTGEPITAQQAFQLGLVEEVVPTPQLMDAALRLAGTIAGKSPVVLRLIKESLNRIEDLPTHIGYIVEQAYTEKIKQTADAQEAIEAFVERRPPSFQGR